MNCKEIAFIICVNDIQYYDECVRYIGELEIPDGYHTDIIAVQEAETIAQGYNAAMHSSDAKYKVYLHQDTFILNKNFIADILHIFCQDDRIGMIGMLGGDSLNPNEALENEWQVGNVQSYDGRYCTENQYLQYPERKYCSVKAVCGFLMATQYDIAWREDIIEGWDFYEISHSMEFQRKGYQVVVPYQDKAWCYHDCCVPKYRDFVTNWKRFTIEYPEEEWSVIDAQKQLERQEKIADTRDIRDKLVGLANQKRYDALCEIANVIRGLWLDDIFVREIVNMMEIYMLEGGSIEEKHSFLFGLESFEEIYTAYRWIRFIIIRMAYKREDERITDFKNMLSQKEITRDAIRKMTVITVGGSSSVYEELFCDTIDGPLVSVILPVYNSADILGETIESILEQTYHNIELIIIDDASTDESRDVILSFQDERLKRIFLEKNKNICNASNSGFEIASGKYIALIGHDDVWKKDKLSRQVQFLEEHPSIGVCFTWADIINEYGKRVGEKGSLYKLFHSDNFGKDHWMRHLLFYGNNFCAPSACIRSNFLDRIGYYRYALVQLQDYDMWLRILLEGDIYVLQEELTLYRRFQEKGRNLSEINDKTSIRDKNEMQWIQDDIINKLSVERFLTVFRKELRYSKASSEKEVMCEKVFLLLSSKNIYCKKRFIELLEDEESRNILEEKYHFSLQDFYDINARKM